DKVWKALEGLTFGIPLILGNGIALYFQHGWYKQIAQHKEKSTDDDGEHGENLQGEGDAAEHQDKAKQEAAAKHAAEQHVKAEQRAKVEQEAEQHVKAEQQVKAEQHI